MITQSSIVQLSIRALLCCLVLSTPVVAQIQSCSRCFCIGQVALCEKMGFTSVPQDFSASITHLNLGSNDISVLRKESLSRYTRLSTLELDKNGLVFISAKAFERNTMLTSLHLGGNRLLEIQSGTFSNLVNLTELNLNNNQLTDLTRGTFDGLANLKTLHLAGNRLRSISIEAMKPLASLQRLDISGNQLHCDCGVAWMKSYGPLRNAINGPVVCSSPASLRATRLEDIELSSLECALPTVEAMNRVVQGFKGQLSVELRCNAEGNPPPKMRWFFHGQELSDSISYRLPKNGSLLIISMVPHLAGDYTCLAGNLMGNDSAVITLEYAGARLPSFLVTPEKSHFFEGDDITLECVVDQFADRLVWEKDGTEIQFSSRVSSVPGEGLRIRSALREDSGTYACVAENEAGRRKAQTVVSVTGSLLSCGGILSREDVDRLKLTVELAVNATQLRLKSATHSPSALLRRLKFPQGGLIERLQAAEIFDQSVCVVRSRLLAGNLTVNKGSSIPVLNRCEVEVLSQLSGCESHKRTADCSDCYHRKYRTIDGSCNNLDHPLRGAAEVPFLRIIPPEYEDGIGLPAGWSTPRPSARLISQRIVTARSVTPSEKFTLMLMQMGQFIDHDLDLAPMSPSGIAFNSANPDSLMSCDDICHNEAPCFPIQVPEGDSRITRQCLSFSRSSAVCGTGAASLLIGDVGIHREQLNAITSYIDGSQIYGSTNSTALNLRTLDGTGRLRRGDAVDSFPDKYFLPFDNNSLVDCETGVNAHRSSCFLGGDIRVNEQVGLTTMHTLFFREHNRVVKILTGLNPHWDGEKLYQEARRIVIAEWQNIVYTEYLPKILGPKFSREYPGYNSSIDPTIANGFATAAYRFGHSQIMPLFPRLDATYSPSSVGDLPLHSAFFAPFRLLEEGGIDPLLRGLISSPVKLRISHQGLNRILTEALFTQAHEISLDLAALNIQRGRDHGLPNYNQWRSFCGLSVAQTIADLQTEISNATVRNRLQQVYGNNPDNIDLWVGGLLEDTLPDSQLGPTFFCIINDQFQRVRAGDRFYFEREGQFFPDQLVQLQQASLSRIICDNADNITRVPADAFILQDVSEFVSCEDLPTVDLQLWKECPDCDGLCQAPAPGLNRNVRSTLFKSMELQDQYNELSVKVAAMEKKLGFCIHKGIYYESREDVDSTDCEKCTCQEGQVKCTQIKCPQLSCDSPVMKDGQCCPICEV